MPEIRNGDISIHYQLDGTNGKPPLVLLHWFMGSLHTWYDTGWVRELSPHFQLILVDHRGYGRSSKPHDPASYRLKNHVSDIEAVLNHLSIIKAHFMGYSMGGRIGFALAAYAPDIILSLVVGGMHPYSSDQIPTDLDQRISLLKQGMRTTLETYGIGPKPVFDRMMQNDPDALLADTIQTKSWSGLDDKIREFSQPVLLFVGKNDGFYTGVKRIAEEMKDVRFVAFPDENHRSAFLKRQLLVPHLRRFLNYS